MVVGTYPFSLIGQMSNPAVAEEATPRISANFNHHSEDHIRAGQRLDLLNVASDARRAKIVEMIIKNQSSRDYHGYVLVTPDPRFPSKGHTVPFPAVAASRPHIVDDDDYRTTFLS